MRKVLTVSIASYNTEAFVEETVRSLFADAETFRKMEVIIVNDGSRDRTGEIAYRLEAEYPETVRVIDKENGGYGSTINASLAEARGTYYKLLDGDDWYQTENLESFIRYLESAEADLVISPYIEVRGKAETPADSHGEIPAECVSIAESRIADKSFMMHEIAVRTECLRKTGTQIAEHRFYTDSEFVFYAMCGAESVSRFDRPVYRYRLGVEGQSVSLQGMRKHYADLPAVAERMMACYERRIPAETGEKKALLDQCIQNAAFHTYRGALLQEDLKESKAELIRLDRKIRSEYPLAYEAGNRGKLVRTLRALRFHGFSALSKMELKRY